MDTNQNKIFDSTLNESRFSFLSHYNLKTPYFIASFLIGIYLLISQISFIENPLVYILFGIVTFYSVLFITINLFTKKVSTLEFDLNSITFKYRHLYGINTVKTLIKSTSIELNALKNHKSHFEGFEIKFKDNLNNYTLKLLDKNWSYIDLEDIYTEFKNIKKESIPESEKDNLHQLKLMNKTLASN